MSKDLTVRVSAKIRDLIRERAAANGISMIEMASVFFNYGLQMSLEAAKQAEAQKKQLEDQKEETTNEA